jgi:predicted DNA-binding ArsR family transcriptional regulator
MQNQYTTPPSDAQPENSYLPVNHNGGPKANNWVAIDRDMRFHPIVGFLNTDGTPRDGRPISETDAWVDLVCEAAWKDREVNNKGKVMIIERGQLMRARNWLSTRWGWSEDKVRWWLSKLEKAGMISRPLSQNHTQKKPQKSAHYINVITLCNYNIYQTLGELDAHLRTHHNTKSTPNQHPINTHNLNKETNKQDTLTDARVGAKPDGVEINCEAIHLHFAGKSKRIPFSTIDLWAFNARMNDTDRARKIVQGVMEGWIADGKLPDKPADTLQRALTYRHIDDEVGQSRIGNERKRGAKIGDGQPGKLNLADMPTHKLRPRDEVQR